jgi:AcrR family transcriptional regulator
MPETDAVRTSRRGRPRSPECDAAILSAALTLLAREGYSRMSMDAVATEAGVSKPTIYARYRGKADLATAALRDLRESGAPAPTGDLRTDLVAQLSQLRINSRSTSATSLVGTCLTEERHTPELLVLFRERTIAPRLAILRALLGTAHDRGELRADADIDAAAILLLGALHAQHMSGEVPDEPWEERIVDTILDGLRAP